MAPPKNTSGQSPKNWKQRGDHEQECIHSKNLTGVERHPRSAGNSMPAGFGAGIARTSGAQSRAARAMTLERRVLRRERRSVEKTIDPKRTHRKNPVGFADFVAERLSLRPHQRRYAALPTALRCIACHPGLYEQGSMGA